MIGLVRQWIEDKKIEPSLSEWSSPAFCILKKAGKWRGVIDYRKLNENSLDDSYSLPLIEDILIRQGKNTIFSVLDLKDAFYQIPLHEADRPNTCMSTPLGSFQLRVLPHGYKQGPAVFQRVIEHTLRDARDVADPYFDDIIIGSHVDGGDENALLEQHDKDLRRVLELLNKDSFVADKNKCKLFVRSVEFCGHVLSAGTRSPAPGKLLSLQKWELLPTIPAPRAFLGLANYYSSYVQNYAEKAAPLMELLKVGRAEGKKGSKFRVAWTPEATESFHHLKSALCETLSLQQLQPDKPFIIHTDASDYAIGAVLEQIEPEFNQTENSVESLQQKLDVLFHRTPEKSDRPSLSSILKELHTRPVAFFSRKLTSSQRKTRTPREKEAYAITSTLKKFASWINFQPVLFLTDHRTLESWVSEVLDTPSGPAARKARWHELICRID
jgi:hypothetical protein